MLKYMLMWIPLLATAFVNAALREMTYAPLMEREWAHRISVLTGIVLIGAVAWLMLKRNPPASSRDAVFGGITWLVMTETFEFCMTVLYSKKPLGFFLEMHNLPAGELWPLLLVWIALLPPLYFRFRQRS
ncbi:MAG TPA: hypothetical protein PK573_16210 [Spirochaetota bacterium]|nr:hypothetical protein [Spirochaetota bacterium]HRZ28404.1 hypothetical protein [Spirochaetota bacterium]